jgi:hypothetical protein
MAQTPRNPTGPQSIQVVGGENLFRLAELFLGDATQWWRIASLNTYPGIAPDFIVQTAGTLLIPPVNPNAVWP